MVFKYLTNTANNKFYEQMEGNMNAKVAHANAGTTKKKKRKKKKE